MQVKTQRSDVKPRAQKPTTESVWQHPQVELIRVKTFQITHSVSRPKLLTQDLALLPRLA